MFKIDKAVAITGEPAGAAKYPWRDMKVGDSFFVPNKAINIMTPAANYGRKITGFKFTCRTVDGGVRVWRIA